MQAELMQWAGITPLCQCDVCGVKRMNYDLMVSRTVVARDKVIYTARDPENTEELFTVVLEPGKEPRQVSTSRTFDAAIQAHMSAVIQEVAS